nr:uncharacterized protein LOC109976788 isoform X2 [Labrus bergylta]
MLENGESDDNEGELLLEVNNTEAETAADYSDKSQQVCDCGWSKWTTDRGLRTHQVKKGCKPRGKRYEGSQQQDMLGKSGLESNQKDFNRDVHNLTTETAADYSDKSQQVCDCGWSKWTTDRGLRTHQVKKGCKPRGKRYEGSQQQDMLGKSGLESNQKDFNRDVHNLTMAETAADYSGKSQQVCDCGWSKWTTDRGLRTHQVKKGCKPRGKSGLKTNKKDDRLDVHNLATDEQVCFCGWSKWTTYHGLRTHQGLKGCTPKGLKIPQSDQHFWKTQWKAMHPQRMTFRKEL